MNSNLLKLVMLISKHLLRIFLIQLAVLNFLVAGANNNFNDEKSDQINQTLISGKVSDENGEALPGATVLEKGTTNGTTTDIEGSFKLNCSGDAVLIISFVGFESLEVPINNQSIINVNLSVDSEQLEEVVVVGYGEVRKSDLTSAIAKVDGEKLQARPVATLDQALQGQLAGVQVQQSGGKPGKNANIRIRGVGSISAGNSPLYVVDGFPVDGETFGNLSASDIESVEVLKDAASTSIYGSRGSNGVIIVTTKRGKGTGLKFDLNVYTGVSNIERRVPLLSGYEYASYMKDAKDNGWTDRGNDPNVAPDDRNDGAVRYDEALVQGWLDNPETAPNYDHLGEILQTGVQQSYQLSASGSTQKVRYMVSGNYFDQTGIIENTDFERYSFRSNVDVDVKDFLTLGFNLAPTYSIKNDKDTEGAGIRDPMAGTIEYAMISAPVLPSRLGYWGESDPFSDFLIGSDMPRALADIEHLKDEETRAQILANVYAQLRLLPGLTFKTSLGANYYHTERNRFENQIISRNAAPQGFYWGDNVFNWLNENILNYNKSVQNHNFNLVLGFTSQKQTATSAYINGTGFANDYVSTLNAASVWTANTRVNEWSLLSYLGRLTYSFSDKYLFSASLRTDGSSRFGANNKWGLFPSVSGGWRIDQEDFMDVDLLSQLKIRASWGKTGNNNIGNYASIASLGTSNSLFGLSEDVVPGAQPSSIANPDLGWEKTTTTDIGIDLGFLDGRFTVSADYYISNTTDLLLDVPVPASTGFTIETKNFGEVENKGLEFEINTVNVDKALNWSTGFNLSFNQNEVIKLGPDNAPIYSGAYNWQNSITTVGYPIGSFYIFNMLGVYNTQEEVDASVHVPGSAPGDVIIEDVNGDGLINADDRKIFGSNNPTYYFGITNRFRFKGFDLSILVTGSGGNQIFDIYGFRANYPGGNHLQHYANWANRWRSAENPGDGKTPKATHYPTGFTAYRGAGTNDLYDGSYVRLKNITLGYTLPVSLLNKIKISKIRVYVQGENLYLWDNYIGFTPETDLNNGSPINAGYDYGTYPSLRTFLFGANVTF